MRCEVHEKIYIFLLFLAYSVPSGAQQLFSLFPILSIPVISPRVSPLVYIPSILDPTYSFPDHPQCKIT
jgi:hypothetical protein